MSVMNPTTCKTCQGRPVACHECEYRRAVQEGLCLFIIDDCTTHGMVCGEERVLGYESCREHLCRCVGKGCGLFADERQLCPRCERARQIGLKALGTGP